MAANVVFFGTPIAAVPFLETLTRDVAFTVVSVVTQPAKSAGRNRRIMRTPVEDAARDLRIPVMTPDRLDATALNELRACDPAVFVVVAYGSLLPAAVLGIPPFGAINVHFSLLPKFRGAAPIEHALLQGEHETGISIMRIDEGLDTGPVLHTSPVPIQPEDTTLLLRERLVRMGCAELPSVLKQWMLGTITPRPQDDSKATISKRIKKEEGRITWDTQTAAHIDRMVRAYIEWPTAFTTWNGKLIKILKSGISDATVSPGLVERRDDTIIAGTASGALHLKEIQLEGKKPAAIEVFLHGYSGFLGSVLGR